MARTRSNCFVSSISTALKLDLALSRKWVPVLTPDETADFIDTCKEICQMLEVLHDMKSPSDDRMQYDIDMNLF